MRKALTVQQIKDAIDRKNIDNIPMVLDKWRGHGLIEQHGEKLVEVENKYPTDMLELWFQEPGFDVSTNSNPEYRFGFKDYSCAERHSIGESVVLLDDWDDLDIFLDHFPNPYEPDNFKDVELKIQQNKDTYKLGGWWRLFHERFWTIRGMENLMMDYYDNMDGLKKIGAKLMEFYKVIVDRFAELGCDGIFSSDDLGHQQGPMMSPATFKELYFPLYKELADYIHSKGMKFFLHSCGDNTLLMEDLANAGLDVFHPIQKGCMDMEQTVKNYGDRMSFLVGFDVQHLIINGTPEEIREDVRNTKRIFKKYGAGLLYSMGNGIMPGTPLENIDAALDEMYNGTV